MTTAGTASKEPLTHFAKVWTPHVVDTLPGGPDIVAIDMHLIHEVTSLQAFEQLDRRGLRVRRPEKTLAVMDHVVPARGGSAAAWTSLASNYVARLTENCGAHGVALLPYGDGRQGIVHIVGPELGMTLPGTTIVCGDSHTSTHGALGAIAFGIGTTQVAHVFATQALLADRPKTMEVEITGRLTEGTSSKDLALALISTFGNQGGAGHAVEFRGPAVSALSIEARMTLCNMGIEFGARMAMIAPDERTISYVQQTQFRPTGAAWDEAVSHWRSLGTDDGAVFDKTLMLDASRVTPYVSWGTTPAHSAPIDGVIPDPSVMADEASSAAATRALAYMQLTPGTRLRDVKIDAAFVGSCTNGRLEDLRAAAQVLRGRHIAPHVTGLAVPGSMTVKARAEEEGLDEIFRSAGFDWGDASCSMCVAANGDVLAPGTRSVSTTNRNFEGRQGTGSRTHLMSPASVAASAVAGHVAEPGDLS